MTVTPFTIDVSPAVIADLQDRLRRTRWPDAVEGAGWDYGAELSSVRALCEYWADGYDWFAQQAQLNELDHFTADLHGTTVHFVHARSTQPDPVPLLLLNGWPSTFVQMRSIIPLLTNGSPAFEVIVPSLPGYGFSSRPVESGMSVGRMAELLHELMTDELGFGVYATRGTDLGAGVLQQLALTHPEALLGLHQGGTNPFVASVPDDLTEAEQRFVAAANEWMQAEMAYAMEHTSKPQTLAFGLNDSPAGLAAWVIEKFHAWSDGDYAARFDRDDLLTNLTIYWVTETIGSSMRLYYETARDPNAKWGRVEVPTAMAMTRDMFPTPREWAERFFNVVRWTELPAGGHFPEWDVPELIAEDLRAFYGT